MNMLFYSVDTVSLEIPSPWLLMGCFRGYFLQIPEIDAKKTQNIAESYLYHGDFWSLGSMLKVPRLNFCFAQTRRKKPRQTPPILQTCFHLKFLFAQSTTSLHINRLTVVQ